MKIGVVSDSHGYEKRLQQAIEEMGEVDLIVHCGDYADDAQEIRKWTSTPVMFVRGNCDEYSGCGDDYPAFVNTTFGGKKLYIVHGHKERVKSSYDHLFYDARAVDADIVLFGHTHVADIEEKDGILMVNPGSCALPQGSDVPTYAIIDLDGEKPQAEIKSFKPKREKNKREQFYKHWF